MDDGRVRAEKAYSEHWSIYNPMNDAKAQAVYGHRRRSWRWLDKFAPQNFGLFVHWEFLYGPPLLNSKRLYGKSRVS